MPKFSIIIPVYNIEQYIKKCVDSILGQSYTDFELILVDDGSPDGSAAICDEYAEMDTRVRVIHKTNGGVSSARFAGSEIAEGDYIVCVDGDDWLADGCFEAMAGAIEESGAEIVCHGFFFEIGNGFDERKMNCRKGFYDRNALEREIFPHLIQSEDAQYFSPSFCNKVVKTELFKKYLLVDKLATIGEDGASVIPYVFNAKSMFVIDESFYYYRYNGGSATKARKPFDWEWPQIVNEHIKHNIDITYGDFEEQLYRKTAHDLFTVVVSQFYKKESYRTIVKDIEENLKCDLYSEAIKKCKFRNSAKAAIMSFALKNKLYFPFYLYSKLR